MREYGEDVYAAAVHRAWSESHGDAVGLQNLVRLALRHGWAWVFSHAPAALRSMTHIDVPDGFSVCLHEQNLEQQSHLMERLAVRVVCRGGSGYPGILEQLHKPPALLYVRGTLRPVEPYAVAVVGTRHPTEYGRIVTERFAYELALRGACIVSGLAYGIDTCAHEGCLRAGGQTIAVLGTGIDTIYPRENRGLGLRVVENGALVSEFALGQRPTRWTFPQRNRIVAALGQALIVVQAGVVSGTRHTIECALDLGRTVFAVPGDIRARVSAGPHRLIREGAELLESTEQVVEKLDWSTGQQGAASQPGTILPSDVDLHAVLALIGKQATTFDQLARTSGLPASELQAHLLRLELSGAIRQLPGLRFVRIV